MKTIKTFEEAMKLKKELAAAWDKCDHSLRQYPTHANGLVTEEVRLSKEYREDKQKYDIVFKQVQELNSFIMRNFKKEYLTYRRKNRWNKLESK